MRTFVTFEDLPYIVHFNSSQLDCDDLIKHQYLPTLPSVLAEFGKFGTLMLTVCCMLTLLVIAIFVEESIILFRRWPLRSYCHTMAILAVFPISCICFFLTMLIPRSNDLNITVATLYQPLSLVLFFKLIVSYMGREKNLKESLMGKQIPTKGPPLYWFCVCFPSCKMNKKLYYLMKACIYQLFMAPCFLYFVMGVCSKTGVYQPGQLSLGNAAVYLVSLGALSFGIGVYFLEILYKMSQHLLTGYYICSKYYILQAFFVITRFLVLSFDALGNSFTYFPCRPPISSFAYGLYIRTAILIVLTFLLSLLARQIFTKPAPSRSMSMFESITDAIT